MGSGRKITVALLMCCTMALLVSMLPHISAYIQTNENRTALGPSPRSEEEVDRQRDQHRTANRQERDNREAQNDDRDIENDNQDYYHVIIENNLFRSLGWKKRKRGPSYELIGTWIESDGKIAKALVVEKRSNQIHYVSAGDKFGDATVEKIEPNQVSLKTSEKVLTLKGASVGFLTGTSRSDDKSRGEDSSGTSRGRSSDEEREGKRENRDNAGQEWTQMREKFRSTSPEERREMIEEFRRRSGAGQRGRSGRRNRRR